MLGVMMTSSASPATATAQTLTAGTMFVTPFVLEVGALLGCPWARHLQLAWGHVFESYLISMYYVGYNFSSVARRVAWWCHRAGLHFKAFLVCLKVIVLIALEIVMPLYTGKT